MLRPIIPACFHDTYHPGDFYGNLDYRLLLSTLPAIFSFAHVFFLRRDMDRSDEERPIKRKEKRKTTDIFSHNIAGSVQK